MTEIEIEIVFYPKCFFNVEDILDAKKKFNNFRPIIEDKLQETYPNAVIFIATRYNEKDKTAVEVFYYNDNELSYHDVDDLETSTKENVISLIEVEFKSRTTWS